jgi:hypothetical protein
MFKLATTQHVLSGLINSSKPTDSSVYHQVSHLKNSTFFPRTVLTWFVQNSEQDRQRRHNVTLKRVRVTIVAVEKQ